MLTPEPTGGAVWNRQGTVFAALMRPTSLKSGRPKNSGLLYIDPD